MLNQKHCKALLISTNKHNLLKLFSHKLLAKIATETSKFAISKVNLFTDSIILQQIKMFVSVVFIFISCTP